MTSHYGRTPGSAGAFRARIGWIGTEPGEETYRCDQHRLKRKRESVTNIPFLFPFLAFQCCRFQTINICGQDHAEYLVTD